MNFRVKNLKQKEDNLEKFLKIILVLIIVFSFFSCGKRESNIVKIALVCPLTGDIAAMGQGMKRGAMLAIEDGNKLESIIKKGLKLELVTLDDRADPKEAVNAANKIISDRKIVGVVGHLNSGCSIPASKIYNRANLVMISPASTNPKLTLQGYKNVFRVCTTDDIQGRSAANFVFNELGFKRVSVIHDKTPYGQGLAEEFTKQFKSLGGTILSFDGINQGEKDFKSLLTRIRNLNPQAIYWGGVYSEGGLITRQAKEIGCRVPLVGADGIFSEEYIKIGGESVNGDYLTMIGLPPEKLHSAKEFILRYKRVYKRAPQPYDAYTYDSTRMIIEAIGKVGLDKGKIIEYISKISYNGIMGKTSFDEKGDTLNRIISIYQIRDNKFEYVTSTNN